MGRTGVRGRQVRLIDTSGISETSLVLPPLPRVPPGSSGSPVLPVLPALRSLFPGDGPRRGTVVSVLGGLGGTSLLLALLAGVSAAGGWCATVGLPALGPPAAAELGVDLERLAAVPVPGPRWANVTAGLLDGFDAVAIRPPARVRAGDTRRLLGRARERGAVLFTAGSWEGAELRMSVSAPRWQGVDEQGHGRLRARCLAVRVEGRGAAARPRLAMLWLPAPGGGCVAAETPTAVGLGTAVHGTHHGVYGLTPLPRIAT